MNNYAINMNQSEHALHPEDSTPFSNKNLRINFIRKVLAILATQLTFTAVAIYCAFAIPAY